MKKFVRPAIDEKLDWDFHLDLPDGSNFISKRVEVDFVTMFHWCEPWLPYWNSMPGAQERRLATKCKEPFRLVELKDC